jgi:hypothetical protein
MKSTNYIRSESTLSKENTSVAFTCPFCNGRITVPAEFLDTQLRVLPEFKGKILENFAISERGDVYCDILCRHYD